MPDQLKPDASPPWPWPFASISNALEKIGRTSLVGYFVLVGMFGVMLLPVWIYFGISWANR